MRVSDFDFHLPDNLIAQVPTPERTGSRLLVVDRSSRALAHRRFVDLPHFLCDNDLLIFNDSRVIPARLRGEKLGTGGEVEMLLTEQVEPEVWWTLLRPGKRVRPGTTIRLLSAPEVPSEMTATVLQKNEEGHVQLRFTGPQSIIEFANTHGEIPLPPYIARPAHSRDSADVTRYQTVYARQEGSVAAPTAGLHFSDEFLNQLRSKGIETRHVTLHVGLGTFAPIKVDLVADHRLHRERYSIPEATALAIRTAKANGRRVVAVGTTSLRVLEAAARLTKGSVPGGPGSTDMFLYPPAEFQVVDALLTNFHLPQSSLLMLVSAFAAPRSTDGREFILNAYREAVTQGYRFFSYGDAMFIQ
ncbi:MAG TPA: tRNA preQ1(34) S-adenosylmethionine ribosyltransferase-isomerase QueA [Candidatus Limnocylindria bacterium]|nr:tRNA preQ1(34) S-adenosylmethionine ribosyltransferase-isomerase QueA [Candidatus Limnocylindria bacterium]